ncbi:MAG: hypothetical protein ACW979_10140 [Candidatus Thorarchaeota archaeon]
MKRISIASEPEYARKANRLLSKLTKAMNYSRASRVEGKDLHLTFHRQGITPEEKRKLIEKEVG